MKVVLKNAVDLEEQRLTSWLKKGRPYVVLAVEEHSSGVAGYRIASEDSGQPVVFRADLFDVCDARLPESWIVLGLQGATLELGPEEFGRAGFWERVFDRDPEALAQYVASKERVLRES